MGLRGSISWRRATDASISMITTGMHDRRTVAGVSVALLTSVLYAHAQTPVPPPMAVPVNAVDGILEAFKSHAVVALGEGPHGNEQGHAFRLSLIRDPRFTAVVNDILVEFGTAKYQALLDRFLGGESVPQGELRRIWQDTTVATAVWERPIYEDFLRAVRALNGTLPASRRIRVWLGDAPIDWDHIDSPLQLRRWGRQKDEHAIGVVKDRILATGRRALIIYGDGHLQGRGFPDRSITNGLERPPAPTKVFAISSSFTDLGKFQRGVSAWPIPSLARIAGTVIGVRPYAQFYPMPPQPGWNTVRLQDQFDAVLYLGDKPRIAAFPSALCRDAEYMKMRLARMEFDAPQARRARIAALQTFCAAQP